MQRYFSYVTAHRCAGGLKKKLNLRLGSQRHRHFVGCLMGSSKHRHGATLFYGYSEKPPHLIAFYDTLGLRRTHSRFNSRVLTGGGGVIDILVGWLVGCGLTTHSAIFQLYSDGRVVQFSQF